ncbi:MAG: hypothetical protein JRI34_02285 [Deltaproteobacteria bacterium]|nr:hypothetical protein [Deltaproteobacteria bacterium]
MSKAELKKSKVTYTLYVEDSETPDEIQRKLLARRIKVLAMMQGENMAGWARELGVSRQAIYHVVEGRRETQRIRRYIEERIGQEFWGQENNEGR